MLFFMSFFNVRVSLNYLFQRITSIYDRLNFSSFYKIFKKELVLSSYSVFRIKILNNIKINSIPNMFLLRFLMPKNNRKGIICHNGTLKLRILKSPIWQVVACTLNSSSLSLGTGFSTSLSCRTSGGPYFVHTIALMCLLIVAYKKFYCLFLQLKLPLKSLVLKLDLFLRRRFLELMSY